MQSYRKRIACAYVCMFLPDIALLGLVSHQQISMHLIHQLRSNPAQWHVHLIRCHVIIILRGGAIDNVLIHLLFVYFCLLFFPNAIFYFYFLQLEIFSIIVLCFSR